jgi:hypothetical protein
MIEIVLYRLDTGPKIGFFIIGERYHSKIQALF